MANDLYVQTAGDAELPRDNEGKIMPLDYGSENRGVVDETEAMDFGKMLLVEYESAESISNKFGTTAELGSSDSYWNDTEIQEAVIEAYGEKDAKENFDMIYRNLEGEYAKYLQQDFEAANISRSMAGATMRGQINKAKKSTPIVRSVIKDMTGAMQFGDKFYGQKNSKREAQVKKVRLQTGTNSDGTPILELMDLTPELQDLLDDRDDIDGFAYNKLQSMMGDNPRAQGFVDVIISGKVWDDTTESYVDVRNDQIVANWDIDDGSIYHTLLKGNGMDMEGFDFAKILLRSPLNTAIEFFDIIPQIGRGILAGVYGENVEQSSSYNYLTSLGIQAKGYKASMSDAALKGGFFGNAEMFTSTIADVASQLILAGGVGKLMSYGVGAYASGATAAGNTLSAKRAMAGMQSIVGNTTRLSLTMMASKDMYQEALEHGFSKREAGFAMGAAVWAMWKANALSGYMTDGIEPSAARYFSSKFAKSHMDDALGAIDKGFIKEIGAKGWMNRMKGLDNAFGKAFASVEKKLATDMTWHAAAREASEEIFEELSTVGVRQMMNEYRAFRGDNLREMAIGEGRFKSYWDPGFWSELAEHLLVSGVAGGFGGVIGKTIHGGAKVSTLTDTSTLFDFVLAGEGAMMRKQIYQAASDNAYGPVGLTTQQDDLTGAYMRSKHNGGTTMNEMVRNSLLQDLTVLETFASDMGLDVAKDMMEGDPALKLHIDETSLLSDIKNNAVELRRLMDVTGVGTKTLLALDDGEIHESLTVANDDRAVQIVRINKEVSEYKEEIQALSDLKTKIHEKEAKEENKDNKKEKPSKFTEEQQKQLDALEKKKEEKEAGLKEMQGEITADDLTAIHKVLRDVRGINNGSAAETYYLEYTLFSDTVFGSLQNREKKFKKYGADFFRKTISNARATMAEINKTNLRKVQKSLDNDKRLLKMTPENIAEFTDIFEQQPGMSKETLQHLFDMQEAILSSDIVSNLQKDYITSEAFIDKAIAVGLAPYADAEFVDESEDTLTPDQRITTILQTPGKAVWAMSTTGKTTLAQKGKHIDFDEYIHLSDGSDISVSKKWEAAKAAGDAEGADTILSNAWEAAKALAAEQGKTLLGSSQDLLRLSTEGKVTLDSVIGVGSFGEFIKRVSGGLSPMSAVEAKVAYNDNVSALNSYGDSVMYTDQFLGDLSAVEQTTDPEWLVDTKFRTPKKLIEFAKTPQFKRIYTAVMKQYAGTMVRGDIEIPLIDLEEAANEFKEIVEENSFTGIDEDYYSLFAYNPIAEPMHGFIFDAPILALQSPNTIAASGKNTTEATELHKEYSAVLNSNDSAQKIKQYMAVVADTDSDGTFSSVAGQANIDPEIPPLYSPFQLEWMDKGLTGGIDSEFVTSGSGLLKKVVTLTDKLAISKDRSAFELSPENRIELQKLQEQIEIRQAQRNILSHLMTSPPYNPDLPAEMQAPSEVVRIASFRENIYKIIGDNNYPLKPRFSGEEEHMYKDHTALSDFINDFIYDPRVILDIERKIAKDNGQQDLTDDEIKLYSQYENFIYNLHPIRTDAASKVGTIEPVQDMISDIIDVRGLSDGIHFMATTHSMEQALEVIKGINFLLDTFPSTDIEGGIAGRTFLDKRHEFMKNRFIGIKATAVDFKAAYDDASITMPEDLRDLTLFISSWDPAATMTAADHIQLEKLLIKFYTVLPQVKKDMPEAYNAAIVGRHGAVSLETKLFSDYDVRDFYSSYKEYLEEAIKSDGQVPLAAQELNALYLNAFILTDGKILSTDVRTGSSTYVFVVTGVAGSGKSHVVAKLGLGLAQRQQAKRYSSDVTKVMVAANFPTQIRNMDAALASSNVETAGEGKVFDELIGTLQAYVDGTGGPSVEAEVESTSVIVYDEYTGINAKPKHLTKEGEKSIHTLQALIEAVNEKKKIKSLARSTPFPSTKLVMLGDERQMGFADDSKVGSSMQLVIDDEGYFKGIEMTENVRASNLYLTEALERIRLDPNMINAGYAMTGNTTDTVGRYAQVRFAKQRHVGNRMMGMQSTTKSFKDVLNDITLADNIEEQIANAKKDNKDFTVGIIPDHLHNIDYSSPIGKLITKYANVFILKTTESIIQDIETDKVQGLEYNYVITEFSKEFTRDMAVVPEDKADIRKTQYTLASRAKDFVVISNTSNAPIVSTKTDEQLVLTHTMMSDSNKKLAYDHIMKVLDNITPTETSQQENDRVSSEEIAEDEVDTAVTVDTVEGAHATEGINRLIKAKAAELLKQSQNDFSESADLIKALRVTMALSPEELSDMFNNDMQPETMTDEAFAWVMKNKIPLKAALDEIKTLQKNELNRIATVFDDAIVKVNAARDGSNGYNKVAPSELKAFSAAVVTEIEQNNADIQLASEDAQKVLKERLKNHFDLVNVDSTKDDDVDEEEDEDDKFYPPNGKEEDTKTQTLIKYQEALNKYDSLGKIITEKDKLSTKVVNGIATALEVDEFNRLAELLNNLAKYNITTKPTVSIDYIPKDDTEVGATFVEDAPGMKKVQEINVRDLYNMKMNQPKNGGKIQLLNVITKGPTGEEVESPARAAEVKFLADLLGIKDIEVGTAQVHDAIHYGEKKFAKVDFVGGMYSNAKGTTYPVAAIIATTQEGKSVLLGRVMLGITNNQLAIYKTKGKELKTALGLDRIIEGGVAGDSRDVIENLLYPTNFALKEKIVTNNGPLIHSIPVDKLHSLISMGAGNIVRTAAKVPFNEFVQNKGINQDVQISKHIMINKNTPLKGVNPGAAFVLYTTNPHIDLDDIDTVFSLLSRVSDSTSDGKIKLMVESKFKTDIGFIPLDGAELTLDDIYNEVLKNDNFTEITQHSRHLIYNDMLTGTRTNNKVAQIMAELSTYLLEDTKLHGSLISNRVIAAKKEAGAKGNITYDQPIIDSLIAGLARVSYVQVKGEKIATSIINAKKAKFFADLKPSETLGPLEHNDILHSIFVPFLRNVRSKSADAEDGVKGNVNLYSLTGGKDYEGNTTAMYRESVNSADGTSSGAFNTLDMLNAIKHNISTLLVAKGLNSDAAATATKKYMQELILPLLSDILAQSNMTKNQMSVQTEVSNENKTSTEKAFSFRGSAVGKAGFTKDNVGNAYLASSIFRDSKDNMFNGEFVSTNIIGIRYPNATFSGEFLLAELNTQVVPPVKPEGALVDMAATVMAEVDKRMAALLPKITAAKSVKDLTAVRDQLTAQIDDWVNEELPELDGKLRKSVLTEADRLRMRKKYKEFTDMITEKKEEFNKEDSQHAVYVTPLDSTLSLDALLATPGLDFGTVHANIQAILAATTQKINDNIKNKTVKVELLDAVLIKETEVMKALESRVAADKATITKETKKFDDVAAMPVAESKDKLSAIVTLGMSKARLQKVYFDSNIAAALIARIDTVIDAITLLGEDSTQYVPTVKTFSINSEGNILSMTVATSDTNAAVLTISVLPDGTSIVKDGKGVIYDEAMLYALITDPALQTNLKNYMSALKVQTLSGKELTQEFVDAVTALQKVLTDGAVIDDDPQTFKATKKKDAAIVDITTIFGTFTYLSTEQLGIINSSLNSLSVPEAAEVVQALTDIKAEGVNAVAVTALRPLLLNMRESVVSKDEQFKLLETFKEELYECK